MLNGLHSLPNWVTIKNYKTIKNYHEGAQTSKNKGRINTLKTGDDGLTSKTK